MSAARKLHIIEIIMSINNKSLLMAMEKEVLRLQEEALLTNVLPNTNAMYEGLGLEGPIQTMRDLSQHTDVAFTPNATGLAQILSVFGGTWENDEMESIESLLNMLRS